MYLRFYMRARRLRRTQWLPMPPHGDGMGRPSAAGVRPTPTSTRWALETAPIRARRGTGSGPTGEGGRAAAGRGRGGARDPAAVGRGHGQPWPPHYVYLFQFLPTAARSPHGSGQVARGRRGPEAACPAHPVTLALQDAAAGAARRTAYRSEEAAARLGFFPSAFPQPTDTRHRRHHGGRSCRERRHGAQRRRRPYVGRLERAPLLAEEPPDGGYCTVRYPRLVV